MRKPNTTEWIKIGAENELAPNSGELKNFNVTNYLETKDKNYSFRLTITDDATGTSASKVWLVKRLTFELRFNLPDTSRYYINNVIKGTYEAIGDGITKTVHFKFDNLPETTYVHTANQSNSGSYTLPINEMAAVYRHGSHFLDAWMTATINGVEISSEHIYRDYVVIDEAKTIPIIGCSQRKLTVKQYQTESITYTVYKKDINTHNITISIDGGEPRLEPTTSFINQYSFKSSEPGTHYMVITYPGADGQADVVKTIEIEVVSLGYDIEIAEGAVVDFDPAGGSNAGKGIGKDQTKIAWTNGTYSMVASDNFDWVRGGY
jgi:hypothetical protein